MDRLGLLASATQLIRGPTLRKEVSYSVFRRQSGSGISAQYKTVTGMTTNLRSYVDAMLKSIEPQSKILVFCLSKSDAEVIAKEFNALFCHAGLKKDERINNLKRFRTEDVRILSCTSILSLGLDLGSVAVVIHFGAPRTLIDFSQESGRVGRKGQTSYCTMFVDNIPKGKITALGIQGIESYVEEDICRRIDLGKSDGVAHQLACRHLLPAALCDLCMWKVGMVPQVVEFCCILRVEIL